MCVYLCLWRLQPCGRNSAPCPRHSRSLRKWRNSPPPRMWCPAQDRTIQKNQIRNKSFLQFYLSHWGTAILWKISQISSRQELRLLHNVMFRAAQQCDTNKERKWAETVNTHGWTVRLRWKGKQTALDTHIHVHINTYTHTAATLLMSSFAKKSEQLVWGSK